VRSSGTGAAESASRTTSTWRISSIAVLARCCAGHRVRRGELERAGLLVAQHLPDRPRQNNRLGVHRAQQSGRQQPLNRAIPRGAGSGIAGAAHRGADHQPVQDVALRHAETVDQPAEFGGGARAVVEHDLAGIPGQRGGRLGGHPQFLVAPHQSAVPQIIDTGPDVGSRCPAADRRDQFADRYRRLVGMQNQQRVEHRQS
jgi:hypothetical protein